jgi:hypothetical protein
MATYLQIRKRVAYLRGETDFTTGSNNDAINAHIQAAILDICNAHNFSWNQAPLTLTVTAGTVNLPTDYNQQWKVPYVDDGTQPYAEIPVESKLNFSDGDRRFYILYDNTNKVYTLKSPTLSASLTGYYYFIPADLTADGDVCVVPDGEAVAYLATSKMWISDERNIELKREYEAEAQTRIDKMYAKDLMEGPVYTQGSVIDYNYRLRQGSDGGS